MQFNVDQYGVMDMGKNLNARKRHDGFCVSQHHLGSRSQGQNRSFYETQWYSTGCKNKKKIRNCLKMNKLNRQYELIQLYESFVGQNLQYDVVFWSAYFKLF